ncbi:MAG TPA: M24 family metallopeptidase [Solirubrobacteraceae bacterium]|nr:M24 family metallopeptidase [Solirubrobacteraceae bacterium]
MNVLIWGSTASSPELRHEVPLAIGDPFLYLEANGRRAVVTNSLEEARLALVAPELERVLVNELGRDELVAKGLGRFEVERETCLRAARALEIQDAVVPLDFPLGLADGLRAAGLSLTPDEVVFTERRRHKTDLEMAGIRRAANAAVEAVSDAAATLRAAEIRGGELWHEGERLTSEAVRARIREVCARAGAPAPPDIMVKAMGPDPKIGHYPGAGPLPADTPILIDLWPRDEETGCWADMTRTFVRGAISDRVADIHRLVIDAHERACAAVRPGIPGVDLYNLVCEMFEAAGHPTARTQAHGQTLRDGFYASLGHGVGLEIHEAPSLGRTGAEPLIAGDVVAVEPGLVVRPVGGTRVEDLLVVTDTGSESLTAAIPHELAL